MTFQRAQKKNEALKAIRNGDSISSWERWGLVWKTGWLLGGFGTAMGHISKHWKKTRKRCFHSCLQQKTWMCACFTLGKIENMFNQSNKKHTNVNPCWFIDKKTNMFRNKTLNKMNKIPQNNTHQIHPVPTKLSITLTLRTSETLRPWAKSGDSQRFVAHLGGRGVPMGIRVGMQNGCAAPRFLLVWGSYSIRR